MFSIFITFSSSQNDLSTALMIADMQLNIQQLRKLSSFVSCHTFSHLLSYVQCPYASTNDNGRSLEYVLSDVITCFQRKDALMSSDGGGGVAESAAAHPGDAGGPGQGEEGAAPTQR